MSTFPLRENMVSPYGRSVDIVWAVGYLLGIAEVVASGERHEDIFADDWNGYMSDNESIIDRYRTLTHDELANMDRDELRGIYDEVAIEVGRAATRVITEVPNQGYVTLAIQTILMCYPQDGSLAEHAGWQHELRRGMATLSGELCGRENVLYKGVLYDFEDAVNLSARLRAYLMENGEMDTCVRFVGYVLPAPRDAEGRIHDMYEGEFYYEPDAPYGTKYAMYSPDRGAARFSPSELLLLHDAGRVVFASKNEGVELDAVYRLNDAEESQEIDRFGLIENMRRYPEAMSVLAAVVQQLAISAELRQLSEELPPDAMMLVDVLGELIGEELESEGWLPSGGTDDDLDDGEPDE